MLLASSGTKSLNRNKKTLYRHQKQQYWRPLRGLQSTGIQGIKTEFSYKGWKAVVWFRKLYGMGDMK
jgi:hypothetical protein